MALDDVQVPAYYVLNRSIDEGRIRSVIDALEITPVVCAVVTDATDARLAQHFTRDILQVKNPYEARLLAIHISDDIQHPVLLIGDVEAMVAVYADSSIQEVTC